MQPFIRRSQIAGMNLHYKWYSLDYCLNSFEKIGFSSIAFWGGPPHFNLDSTGYQDVKTLGKKFRDHGLCCTCFTAAAIQPGYQYAISGKEHIEDTFRYFSNGIRIASELGAKVMIANSGYGYINEPRDDGLNRAYEMFCRVAEVGHEYGVTLTIESLRPPETRLVVTLADTKKIVDEVNHPNFKAMIDTTAMGVSGETVWDWFKVFGNDIANMHFVDGTPFGHLSWGDGNYPLEDILRCFNQYGYEGPLGLEITDERYYADPSAADAQTFKNLERFVEE